MKRSRPFAIPSLILAGFVAPREALASIASDGDTSKSDQSFLDLFQAEQTTLVSSHASHASHASHVSHASGSTDGYPLPLYSPLPPLPPAPLIEPVSELVVAVQQALIALGYYSGPLTGQVDDPTRQALAKFQLDWKLPVTGTVTPEVVTALKIGT